MKKEKAEIREMTDEEAEQFLHAGGETTPSRERIEVTRRVLNLCIKEGMTVTGWNQPLYPEFDWCDMEFPTLVEEEWDTSFDEEAFNKTPLHTFGELVCFVEMSITDVRNRLANEKAKLANANCATQSAFYAIRRRLSDTGAAYYKVHGLHPNVRLLDVPANHAEPLARKLGKDYGLSLSVHRVLWGRISTAAVQWAFFVASTIFCVFASFHLPFIFWGGTMLCLLMNVAFGCLVARYSRYKWPKEYQTLGDVARKIAESATHTAQPAQS